MKKTDTRERRLSALRAEVAHRLAEITRLERDTDLDSLLQAIRQAPSIPPRKESDFGTDIYS